MHPRQALLAAAVIAATIVPAASANAAADTAPGDPSDTVAGLATDAADWLDRGARAARRSSARPVPSPTSSWPATGCRPSTCEGNAILDQFDRLGVSVSPSVRAALALLPALGERLDAGERVRSSPDPSCTRPPSRTSAASPTRPTPSCPRNRVTASRRSACCSWPVAPSWRSAFATPHRLGPPGRGRARRDGVERRSHRRRQPPPPRARSHAQRRPRARADVGDHGRRRPLQGRQRLVRSSDRRRRAAPGGHDARRTGPRPGRRVPLRRRGVLRAAARRHDGGRPRHRRTRRARRPRDRPARRRPRDRVGRRRRRRPASRGRPRSTRPTGRCSRPRSRAATGCSPPSSSSPPDPRRSGGGCRITRAARDRGSRRRSRPSAARPRPTRAPDRRRPCAPRPTVRRRCGPAGRARRPTGGRPGRPGT